MKKILIATSNQHKFEELKNLLKPLGYEVISLKDLNDQDVVKEDGQTFKDNALLKASYYFSKYQIPTIADDSGIMIDYFGGLPMVKSARFLNHLTHHERNNLIINVMHKVKNRLASFNCCLVYQDAYLVKIFQASLSGEIAKQTCGNNGFGYDEIFYLKEYDKTLAEFDFESKNKLSHRGKAVRKMVQFLEKY